MGRKKHRVEVRLSEARFKKLVDMCGGNPKDLDEPKTSKDLSMFLREQIDREHDFRRFTEMMYLAKDLQEKDDYRFDLDKFIRERVGSEDYLIDYDKMIGKLQSGDA